MSSLQTIADHRQEILWWEIASLMHDIGKLSDDFLHYRQNWHTRANGWNEDPHDQGWFVRPEKPAGKPQGDKILFTDFPALATFFEAKQVAGAVNDHIDPPKGHPNFDLLKLLQLGDGTDSRYDRNNPLAANEQTVHNPTSTPKPEMFRSNVFGYEDSARSIIRAMPKSGSSPLRPEFETEGVLNRARRELYGRLQKIFEPYFKAPEKAELSEDQYSNVRCLLKKYFEPAMSDTTRPCNDTSLWEHVYSVASITKALQVKHIVHGVHPNWNADDLFFIWGFGFDSLRYLSFAHKIGDVLGRKKVLQEIFDAAEELVQYTYPLGNCVYRDDNCLFFLTAAVPELFAELRGKVIELAQERSEGELAPHFTQSKDAVRNLTEISGCIERLRTGFATPIGAHSNAIRSAAGKEGSICPICRLRIANPETKICRTCMTRRKGSANEAMGKGQTPFLSEIADKHGRAALIVAKFGLEKWLDGSMIRTTLITEPVGADRMRQTFQYFEEQTYKQAAASEEVKAWLETSACYNYQTMFDEFERCSKEGDEEFKRSGFLYGRAFKQQETILPVWAETRIELEAALGRPPGNADLFNAVCAKTPTPSTVLDVWDTTFEFLDTVAARIDTYAGKTNSNEVFSEIPSFIETLKGEDFRDLQVKQRRIITVSGNCSGLDIYNSFDDVRIGESLVEVVYLGNNRFALLGDPSKKSWEGTLKLADPDLKFPISASAEKQEYLPYRLITSSPDLLLLLVPASTAIPITTKLYKRYLKHFGKVYGRLPFSIGNIFFPKFLPMFSVLDAARRMERNFRELHRQPRLLTEFKKPDGISLKLGDDSEDHYHPYVITKDKHPKMGGYFETTEGPMVSMSESPQDALLYSNYYDFEWLGSSADRLRIQVGPINKCEVERPELCDIVKRPRGGPGPILLDELRERVIGLWEDLKKSGVSDSRIRNLETLIQDREKAWPDQDPESQNARLEVAAAMMRHYLPKELAGEVVQAHKEGFLTYTLSLFLHVLKEKLEKEKLEVKSGASA